LIIPLLYSEVNRSRHEYSDRHGARWNPMIACDVNDLHVLLAAQDDFDHCASNRSYSETKRAVVAVQIMCKETHEELLK
jgi:hypothetical protein